MTLPVVWRRIERRAAADSRQIRNERSDSSGRRRERQGKRTPVDYRHMILQRDTGPSSGTDAPETGPASAATNRRPDVAGATDRSTHGSSTPTNTAEVRTSEGCHSDGGEGPDRTVLVPMDEYRPGMTGRVVDRLPAPIVVELLALPNGETVPVLTQPDEYTGYVVRSEPAETQVWSTMIVFTRESLEKNACYAFEAGAQVFSTQLALLRTTARRIGSADSAPDENDGD